MKPHRILIITGTFILIFSLYKIIEQATNGLPEHSPWPLDFHRANMDIDAANGRENRR